MFFRKLNLNSFSPLNIFVQSGTNPTIAPRNSLCAYRNSYVVFYSSV